MKVTTMLDSILIRRIVLVVVLLMSWPVASAPQYPPKRSAILAPGQNTQAWMAAADVKIYASPDVTGPVLESLSWTDRRSVDHALLGVAPSGWLPLLPFDGRPAGWVREEGVVLGDGMRRVIACWPIKFAYISIGDYAVRVQFNRNGTGVAVEESDEPDPKAPDRERIHVYMEKNLVALVRLRTGKADFVGFIPYEEGSRTLHEDMASLEKQQKFSDAELRGCGPQPMLRRKSG